MKYATNPVSAVFTAILLWAVAIVAPILFWYLDSHEFKTILFLAYPVLLSLLSRTGAFWVREDFIAYSSIAAFLFAVLLNLSPNVRESLKEPEKNKALSGVVLSSIGLVFLITMGSMGLFYKPIYNPANFSSNPF
jgi:hypothetical protein